MNASDPRLLNVLEQISQQQAQTAAALLNISKQHKGIASHQENISAQLLASQTLLSAILAELQQPPANTGTADTLRALLKPLVQSLDALSRKLPEPPRG